MTKESNWSGKIYLHIIPILCNDLHYSSPPQAIEISTIQHSISISFSLMNMKF